MSRRLRTLLSLLVGITLMAAQTPSSGAQQQRVIDGRTNPAAIPDHVAYRLVLLSFSVGSNASAVDLKRQEAHLRMLGFTDSEKESFRQVMRDFRSQHERWQAKQKNGTAKNSREFKKQLVQRTRAAIAEVLTPQHLADFDRFVQARKANIVTMEVE